MSDEALAAELSRISQRVRHWREKRKLTLQELAERSGLATSTIHKVESAQMIPSVAVLLKIARGLGRRPAELIHDETEALEVLHVRADERHALGMEEKMLVERLSADLPDPALEMWRVKLHPGVSSGEDAIQFDGEELVVCEAGEVTFQVGMQEYVLRAGDTLHFKASIPHRWRNTSDAPAHFTITGTFPLRFRAAMQGRVSAVGASG